jgi:hypothetical protein
MQVSGRWIGFTVLAVVTPVVLAAGLIGCEPAHTPLELDLLVPPVASFDQGTRRGINAGDEPRIQAFLNSVSQLPKRPDKLGECRTLILHPTGKKNSHFKKSGLDLEFSQDAHDAAGGDSMRYRYWRATPGEDPILTRYADCLVPRSQEALDEAWEYFRVRRPSGEVATASEGSFESTDWLAGASALLAGTLLPGKLNAAAMQGIDPDCEATPDFPECQDYEEEECDTIIEAIAGGCRVPDGYGGFCTMDAGGMWTCDHEPPDWRCDPVFDPYCLGPQGPYTEPPDTTFGLGCEAVTRAAVTTCTATMLVDGTPELDWTGGGIQIDWKFQPRDVDVWPLGDPIDLTASIPILHTTTSTDKWTGKVVVEGTVTAQATVYGAVRDFGPAEIVLEARTGAPWVLSPDPWSGDPYAPDDGIPARGTISGGSEYSLGWNVQVTTGDRRPSRAFTGSPTLMPIGDNGPNHGYVYVSDPGLAFHRTYQLRRWITPQEPTELVFEGALYTPWEYLGDQNLNRQVVLDGTIAHEGEGWNGKPGHQSKMVAALTASNSDQTCANPVALLERLGGIQAEVNSQQMLIRGAAGLVLFKAASHHYVYDTWSNGTLLEYDSPTDYEAVTVHSIGQQPDTISLGYASGRCFEGG